MCRFDILIHVHTPLQQPLFFRTRVVVAMYYLRTREKGRPVSDYSIHKAVDENPRR